MERLEKGMERLEKVVERLKKVVDTTTPENPLETCFTQHCPRKKSTQRMNRLASCPVKGLENGLTISDYVHAHAKTWVEALFDDVQITST